MKSHLTCNLLFPMDFQAWRWWLLVREKLVPVLSKYCETTNECENDDFERKTDFAFANFKFSLAILCHVPNNTKLFLTDFLIDWVIDCQSDDLTPPPVPVRKFVIHWLLFYPILDFPTLVPAMTSHRVGTMMHYCQCSANIDHPPGKFISNQHECRINRK